MLKTVSIAVLLLGAAPALAAVPSFTPLGDLPGGEFHSLALDISADGQVVVGMSSSGPGDGTFEAFRWTESTGMIGLNNPGDDPTVVSRASAASADGSVVVGSHTSAFRWTSQDGIVGLGFLSINLPDSSAFGLSADGTAVVGQSMSGPPDVEAIRWTQGTGMVGLGNFTLVPPGFFYALGWGVSADGNTVVGQARTVAFEEAFRWTEETGMVSLDPLRGTTFYSSAEDASADGSIIVGIGEGLRAMVWDINYGMRDIQSLLENEHGLDLGDWVLSHAYGVSDDGTSIVGVGNNPSGDWEAWLVTLPRSVSAVRINGLQFVDPLAGN